MVFWRGLENFEGRGLLENNNEMVVCNFREPCMSLDLYSLKLDKYIVLWYNECANKWYSDVM